MSDQTPDIVERLRSHYKVICRICGHMNSDMGTVHAVMTSAADEIERLRAEIEDMKNALWKACGDDEDAVAECLAGDA